MAKKKPLAYAAQARELIEEAEQYLAHGHPELGVAIERAHRALLSGAKPGGDLDYSTIRKIRNLLVTARLAAVVYPTRGDFARIDPAFADISEEDIASAVNAYSPKRPHAPIIDLLTKYGAAGTRRGADREPVRRRIKKALEG